MARSALASSVCTNLPPSQFQLYQTSAQNLDERAIPDEQLDRYGPGDDLISRHTMMLTGTDVGIWHSVQHRVLARGDSHYCDSPVIVRVYVGSRRRSALFARSVAADECLRPHMLDHEAAHRQAFDDAISRFIIEQRDFLQRGLVALKQTPGSSPEGTVRQWEEGLHLLFAEALDRLMGDLRATNLHVDSPAALSALESACNGRIRKLQSGGTP